jgi:hypothetical protein
MDMWLKTTLKESKYENKWKIVLLGEIYNFHVGTVFNPVLQDKLSRHYRFLKVSDINLPVNTVRIKDANNWSLEWIYKN